MKLYDYKLMSLSEILWSLAKDEQNPPLTSRLASDGTPPLGMPPSSSTFQELLEDGYRWIRTDRGYAVFEKDLT